MPHAPELLGRIEQEIARSYPRGLYRFERESAAFKDGRWRWLYTAITRAAKTVTVVS